MEFMFQCNLLLITKIENTHQEHYVHSYEVHQLRKRDDWMIHRNKKKKEYLFHILQVYLSFTIKIIKNYKQVINRLPQVLLEL